MNFFFFNDTATTEIYTLSLHDALPISLESGIRNPESAIARPSSPPIRGLPASRGSARPGPGHGSRSAGRDRKSTRLNSSHANISYAVFCLKKKTNHYPHFLPQLSVL